MAKPTCRCKKHDACEECPEWIFTFADLVMLMMGFFVILWVLKPAPAKNNTQENNEEMVKVEAGIRRAFGYTVANPQSNDPVDVFLMHHNEPQIPMAGPGEKGRARLQQKGADGSDAEVTDIRPGDQSTDGGKLVFDKGSAELNPVAKDALDQMAGLIVGHRNVTMIKGHAAPDEIPESSGPEMAMQLSIRRAQAVADYLISRGVKPIMLRVEGCSTFEPLRQREFGANAQAMNRRVEIEAVSKFVEDYQDQSHPATEQMNEAPATHPNNSPAQK